MLAVRGDLSWDAQPEQIHALSMWPELPHSLEVKFQHERDSLDRDRDRESKSACISQ